MGRKENLKRMKKLREQKQLRQASEANQKEMNSIAEEAMGVLQKKLSPFHPMRRNTGSIKYSDVLSSFVRPYLDESFNFNETQGLFFAGSAAWNMAITKQVSGEDEFEKALKLAKEQLQRDHDIRILEELIARKLKDFAHFKIIFTDVVLTETEKPYTYGVSVAVTPLK